jgi:ribose transport system ATP-binding protein
MSTDSRINASNPAASVADHKKIDMSGIEKRFFATLALDKIDFTCMSGEVHALVGLNGAGKSTLMKVLGGVIQADEGRITLNDAPVKISSPSDAAALGISMIHQEYSLINELTVAGNIFLGRELKRAKTPFINKSAMAKRVRAELQRFGLSINPTASVRELNSGEKQIVEIIRSLMSDSWLIVMDEPTSALSEEDKERLFTFIRRMKSEGISIIYISHHMPEIFGIADRVTVMRDGRIVLSAVVKETSESEVIEAMTGKELENFIKPQKQIDDQVLLSIERLSRSRFYSDVSFNVRKSEIVVLTGLRGCGGAELLKAVFGLDGEYSGEIRYQNQVLQQRRGPAEAIRAGMGLVTENRDKNGILAPLSIRDNIALPFLEKCTSGGLIVSKRINQRVANAVNATSTKMASADQEIRFLSGGNKQKICFSRWLDSDLKLLILMEPTRGIDVHAKADIYRIIETLAENGVGILILSYEIDEVMMLADRVITLYHGRVAGEYTHAEFDRQKMLSDVAGASESISATTSQPIAGG